MVSAVHGGVPATRKWRGMLEGCVEVSLRRQLMDEPGASAEVTLFDMRVCVQRGTTCGLPVFRWSLSDPMHHALLDGEDDDEAAACRRAARAFSDAVAFR